MFVLVFLLNSCRVLLVFIGMLNHKINTSGFSYLQCYFEICKCVSYPANSSLAVNKHSYCMEAAVIATS